jgi:glycosyltransferase involved in cell wall biosynthesis
MKLRVGIGVQLLAYPRAAQGGLGTYVRALAAHLDEVADDVTVVELGGTGGRAFAARPVRLTYEQVGLPIAARRSRLDVFHCLDQVVPVVAAARRTVVTVHDLAMVRLPETFGRRRARYKTMQTRHAVRRAAMVIADSESTRCDLVELLGVSEDRIRVVHLGVDPRFGPDAVRDWPEVRARYGLPDEFLLYAGRLEPRKNVAGLLEGYARARRQHGVRLPLVVAGPPSWLADDVPDLPRRLSIADSTFLTGYVDDEHLGALFARATAFVYPALYEGFGLPVAEAMASGVPVITSNLSALPEVAAGAARLVNPRDADELALALAEVEQDGSLRERMRRAGLDRARQLTWERTARATVAVYREAAAR